ncbi:Poly(ribitol-phosphate) beta-glucosyltransferase [Burkholderiales bacterium]|nr:Poly(ribitol-phosphate) beta-glucosyltransferase [Burkholderiales bacterium]
MSVRFSVVIPAWQAERVIAACLDALAAQTVAREHFEVIVVDDGSTDATAEIAAAHGATLIRQANAGPAAARNAGARRACGEIVLFTDADCRPDPHWLAAMARPFEKADVTAVQGRYVGSQPEIAARFSQLEFEERYERIPDGADIDFVFTYSAAYRRDVFVAEGGFDTAFPAPNGEDMDLAFRLKQKGHRFAFAREALVRHVHPTRFGWYFRQKFTRAYWRQRVYARFPGKAVSDSYTPKALKFQILLGLLLPFVVAASLFGHPVWIGVWMVAFFGACSRMLLLTRRLDPSLLPWIPFGCLLRAVALGAGSVAGIAQWIDVILGRKAEA